MTLVYAEFSQIVISGLDDDLVVAAGLDTDLAAYDPSASLVSILTGTGSGDVDVVAAHLEAPSEVGDQWSEVVEFSCACGSGIGIGSLTDAVSVILVEHGGQYRVRVSARGRAAGRDQRGPVDPDAEEVDPVEFYLIEAWSAPSGQTRIVRKAEPPEPVEEEPALAGEQAGIAAAADLAAILDRRPFDVPVNQSHSSARVEVTIPMTARRLFRHFNEIVWVSCFGFNTLPPGIRQGYGDFDYDFACYNPEEHPRHRFFGTHGSARGVTLERKPPQLLVRTWSWYLPPVPSEGALVEDMVRFPVAETELRIQLTPAPADHGPQTRVELTHSKLPARWGSLMADIWQLALEGVQRDAPTWRS